MTNVNEISTKFNPASATDPADLSRQAMSAWIKEASNAGIQARQVAGQNSIGVVEANGEYFSLDLQGDRIEPHKLTLSKSSR